MSFRFVLAVSLLACASRAAICGAAPPAESSGTLLRWLANPADADRPLRAEFLDASGRQRDLLALPTVRLDRVAQLSLKPAPNTDRVFVNNSVRVTLETISARSVAVTWSALDSGVHDFELAIEDNSKYYGCGERFSSLNHKGMILPMASTDHPEDKGVGSYKPIPFFMSTRGYAAWLDSSAPGTFDLNATDRHRVLLRYRACALRLVLIAGPDFAAMLDEFTRLTGRPRVPPAWAFAPWKSRNVHRNREEVLADAELSRKHDLPASVIVLDSPWERCYNDFILNDSQFRQPDAMFRRLRELGFHPCLWLTPFINVENLVDMDGITPGPCGSFAEADRRGFLVRRPDGRPMIVSWWKGRGALIDFTNPAARAWWLEQVDVARRWGLRALKCDDGEGNFVEDAVFFDGTPAVEMKSRYAALYLKTAQEFIDTRLKGDGVLFGRCGFTGTQSQPFCWAGDNEASFSFENGLPSVMLAGQNAALSGLPFWAHDIAGYIGTPDKELFIRWTQFGALSPCMQVHMTSNLGPWDFDEQTLSIYRMFAKLHTQLFPYLYDAAHQAAATGMPIIRPMVLAFPTDPAASQHRYQYMFGPDLLVAPIYQPGTHRSVYLPTLNDGAKWIDFWTGTAHAAGKTIEVDAPLERMPLFVRGGALLCMLPAEIDTLIPRNAEMSRDVVAIDDRRVLTIWPGPGRSLATYDGIHAATSRSNGRTTLSLSSRTPRPIEVRQMIGGVSERSLESATRDGWTIDRATNSAHRQITAGPTAVTVQLID